MAQDVQHFHILLNDIGADNRQVFVLRAPSDANGGGLRLLSCEAISASTVTNSLGVGGTTFTLALHKYSNAGTPAVNGTIAAAVGGTAVGWTAGVPQAFTLDTAYSFLDAGEYLVAQYNEVNAGNPVAVTLVGTYINGK